MNESFWDAHGVWGMRKIQHFLPIGQKLPAGQKNVLRANFVGSGKMFENRACLNLDPLSVPEALVHSSRILEVPAVFLKHRGLKS